MTTNSFGSALPRFDFPRQPAAPKLTAQAARAFPTVAIVATAGTSPIQLQLQLTETNTLYSGLLLHILLLSQSGISYVHTFFDTE